MYSTWRSVESDGYCDLSLLFLDRRLLGRFEIEREDSSDGVEDRWPAEDLVDSFLEAGLPETLAGSLEAGKDEKEVLRSCDTEFCTCLKGSAVVMVLDRLSANFNSMSLQMKLST